MLISGKGKCFHGIWLHFKKISGKYFLMFGKEEGKDKPKKNIINDRDPRSRSRDQRRELATARSLDRRITRSHWRDLAIDASRDHAIDRDLHNDRRTGAREIGAAWSSESAGDHRTDWNVLLLSRARALSLSLSLFPEML